jgi:hypothetical protein
MTQHALLEAEGPCLTPGGHSLSAGPIRHHGAVAGACASPSQRRRPQRQPVWSTGLSPALSRLRRATVGLKQSASPQDRGRRPRAGAKVQGRVAAPSSSITAPYVSSGAPTFGNDRGARPEPPGHPKAKAASPPIGAFGRMAPSAAWRARRGPPGGVAHPVPTAHEAP